MPHSYYCDCTECADILAMVEDMSASDDDIEMFQILERFYGVEEVY